MGERRVVVEWFWGGGERGAVVRERGWDGGMVLGLAKEGRGVVLGGGGLGVGAGVWGVGWCCGGGEKGRGGGSGIGDRGVG